MRVITRRSGRWFPLAAALCLACSNGGPKPAASEPAKADGTAAQGAPAAPAKREIAKIVFVDQAEACKCTTERIATSWAALVEALGDPPRVPVERVHLDTEQAKADVYDEMEALVIPPGIYFLDEKEALVKLLQGEVTPEQISAVLDKNAP
jgi:hypothetical protein